MNGAMSWPFLRLYLLALLYFSANAFLNVIIPLQAASWGTSSSTIGLIMGAYMFTTMLFRPWAGKVIQKHGSIRVLRFILVINGCALIIYTISGLEGYLLARMLQGISTAFFSMALQMGIIDALPDQERSQGISFYSLFSYMPGIIGPVLALALWQSGGMDSFIVLLIVIAIATGCFGFTVKMDGTYGQLAAKPNEGMNTIHSFAQLVQNRYLFTSSLIMVGASIIFGAITTFMPLYNAQLTSGNAGIYLMLQAGTVVFVRFAFRKKIPSDGKWHSSFMMGTILLITVASGCISFSQEGGGVILYGGAILMGAAQALLYPTLTTYLSFVLPPPDRNVLMGLFIATADLGVSLGGIVMGPIADISSYSFMFSVCAVLSAVLLLFTYFQRNIMIKLPKS